MGEGRNRGQPLVKVRLYVEGGPKSASANGMRLFRTSFKQHLAKLHSGLNTLEVSPCGSTDDAIRDYARALRGHTQDRVLALLVDSESAVTAHSAAMHLQPKLDSARVPQQARENTFLMVQCMESWLVTDLSALEKCFGAIVKEVGFPRNPDIEAVPKNDVLTALDDAARKTPTGRYHKIRDGAKILANLDPARVAKRSAHARALHEFLVRSVGA